MEIGRRLKGIDLDAVAGWRLKEVPDAIAGRGLYDGFGGDAVVACSERLVVADVAIDRNDFVFVVADNLIDTSRIHNCG